jgi:hypothetical protein
VSYYLHDQIGSTRALGPSPTVDLRVARTASVAARRRMVEPAAVN